MEPFGFVSIGASRWQQSTSVFLFTYGTESTAWTLLLDAMEKLWVDFWVQKPKMSGFPFTNKPVNMWQYSSGISL